jgi:hypothetical protein
MGCQNPRHFFGKQQNELYDKHRNAKPVITEMTLSIVPFNPMKYSFFDFKKENDSILEEFDPVKFLMQACLGRPINDKPKSFHDQKCSPFKIDVDMDYDELNTSIKSLKDVIALGKSYEKNHKFPFDMEKLFNLVPTLEKLDKMIGMKKVKDNIVDQIVYFLSGIEENNNMLHTVITGSPGVGKTVLGRIIGEIYYSMGILKGSGKKYVDPLTGKQMDFVFKIAKRSDLIGEYLGHTATKTQKVIDECQGGVLFIDEAYSLGSGNNDKKDSYAKECIDTLNQNLSENKRNFICIIAGYPEELEKCFFSQNEGLRRRFPFKYDIDKYDYNELANIFMSMLKDSGWNICDDMTFETVCGFMKENYEHFPFFGGDVETLLFHVKIAHAHRVLGIHPRNRKNINIVDIKRGFDAYIKYKGVKKEESMISHIYT